MDSSPEISESKSNSTPSTLSSGPFQVQESPVFSYISNLSPINPDKAAPVAQGFPGINSPPLVFRSPQINLNSQPTFLRRPQFAGSSDTRLSGQDESFEATVIVTEESGISSSHLSSGLRTCPEKELVTDNSPPKKASSLLGCADDYLSENVMMAGGDSASLTNLTPKNSGVIFQSQTDLLDSKEIVDKTEDKDKDDPRKDRMKMEASPEILVQAEEDYQKNPLSDLKSFEPNRNSGDGNTPPEICSKTELDTSVDHALDNQHKDKNAGSGHLFEVGSTSPLESLQMAKDCGSFRENAGGPYSEAVKNKMHDHSPKVVQHQHGISRRLQFEDTQNKITANIGFQNSSESADYPSLPASPSDSEVIESASLDKPTSPSKRLLDNMTLPMFPFQNDSVKVSKRSGIGLHLNSIVNSTQMGSGATMVSMKSVERGTFGGLGNKSIPITSCHLSKKCSNSSNVECVSMSSNDSRHDTHPSIAASSVSLSPYSMKPLYEAVVLKPVELQSTLSNKRMSNSETSDSCEDFGQSSPRKKRKKTLDAGDGNGCKRCNCKKTKCLKLYCDCFAAGIYCAEPCACQGCFNRPEYEDTVLETRQQIESRNPLAFAPKIVQHVTEPPTNIYADDGGHFTPSSARHKRGCNCKKSKCLKKYCECYQANVGCSDGCCCEACENVYGRKGEYGIVKGLVSKQDNSETRDSSFDMTLETVEPKYGLLHSELYKAHSLTPLTPSFQCSDHGKVGSKASGRYHPSPESGLTFIAPCGTFPGQATNHDIHDMILETNPEILDLVSFDQDLGYGNGHTVNKFSPGCDVPSNAGHLTALPNPQDWANTSRAQMFPRNRQVSSASSLRWRSSPITPSTNFGETKLHEAVDFDGGLFSIMDDDTPEILKDTPMPTHAVKVSSPNKKRISPPHGRGTKLGSSSSASLRTGRKFILQAVPSFPPLTPCIKSKAGSSQNTSNSQNSSRSK